MSVTDQIERLFVTACCLRRYFYKEIVNKMLGYVWINDCKLNLDSYSYYNKRKFLYWVLTNNLLINNKYNPMDWQPICLATGAGFTNLVKQYLTETLVYGDDYKDYINEAFVHACSTGKLELVELLLKDHRVNFEYNNHAALYWTCMNSQWKVRALLIEHFLVPTINQNFSKYLKTLNVLPNGPRKKIKK